jgi:Tol biopolymer transport system component
LPTFTPSPKPSATTPALFSLKTFCATTGAENDEKLLLSFAAKWDDDSNIYTVRVDGSDVRRIISDPGDDVAPAWSPDGSKLAWISSLGSEAEMTSHLYIASFDGSNKTALVTDRFVHTDFSWSPDSKKIAFSAAKNPSSKSDIFAIEISNGSLTVLDPASESGRFGGSFPVWSADGTTLAFQAPLDPALIFWRIHTVMADGMALTELLSNTFEDRLPQWDPKGPTILFVSTSALIAPGQLYIMNSDGSDRRQLTDTSPSKTLPRWSPNGEMIAFVGHTFDYDESGKQILTSAGIYLLRRDGTEETALLEDTLLIFNMVWSPDNRKIAVTAQACLGLTLACSEKLIIVTGDAFTG